jgi:hypothetical protein
MDTKEKWAKGPDDTVCDAVKVNCQPPRDELCDGLGDDAEREIIQSLEDLTVDCLALKVGHKASRREAPVVALVSRLLK